MLRDIGRFLRKSLLEALHEIHQVFYRVLLLAHLTHLAGVVHHILKHTGRVNILLIGQQELREQKLQLSAHHLATLDALLHFGGVLGLLSRLLSLVAEVGIEELVCHIGKEEESLDERVEVTRISDVFEPDGHFVHAHSLVQGQRLSLQTCLDRRCHLCIFLPHTLADISACFRGDLGTLG